MSELAKEIIPIVVMYGFVLLLAPFIGVTMWIAFDGDRLREPEDAAATTEMAPSTDQASVPPREALGAA